MRTNYHLLNSASGMPSSRRRSLLRDLADGLLQQMFLWGCDARHPNGNLLVRAGLDRIARVESGGEGSSRYRTGWSDGLVELHSFCVGWYPNNPSARGAIFIRASERLAACRGMRPLTPGQYEPEKFSAEGADALLLAVRPLVGWILAHEEKVQRLAGTEYRQKCWKRYHSQIGGRPWLSPDQAENWFRDFLKAPGRILRPRELQRSLANSRTARKSPPPLRIPIS